MNKIRNFYHIGILRDSVYFKIFFLLWALVHNFSFGQRYTGYLSPIVLLWGGLLLIRNLFIDKAKVPNILMYLIYAFLASYVITIIINRNSNLIGNTKTLIWAAIMTLVLFISEYSDRNKKVYRDINIIAKVLVVIIFIISLLSIAMFALDISFNIILARIIAIFGTNAIAAQKIGLQIESITYMAIGGLNGAISSFTGQNFGAKKFRRIKDGYSTALIIGISYSLLMSLIFIFFKEPIIKLFIRDINTSIIAYGYLQAVAYSQAFSTIEMVSNGLFTGLGKPKIPATISIIFTILRIPMALILMKSYGINGVWWSIAISSILKGSVAYLIYKLKVSKEYKIC